MAESDSDPSFEDLWPDVLAAIPEILQLKKAPTDKTYPHLKALLKTVRRRHGRCLIPKAYADWIGFFWGEDAWLTQATLDGKNFKTT